MTANLQAIGVTISNQRHFQTIHNRGFFGVTKAEQKGVRVHDDKMANHETQNLTSLYQLIVNPSDSKIITVFIYSKA